MPKNSKMSNNQNLEMERIISDEFRESCRDIRNHRRSLRDVSYDLGESNVTCVKRYRTTSIHRNKIVRQPADTYSSGSFGQTLESKRRWMNPTGLLTESSLEQRAVYIANHMLRDDTLMGSTSESKLLRRYKLKRPHLEFYPLSPNRNELFRSLLLHAKPFTHLFSKNSINSSKKEALRDMPQGLTLKRLIKKKLYMLIYEQTQEKSTYKRMKQDYDIKRSQTCSSIRSLAYSFELWYSSLKTIEGHFGSGVATYFKFFRWLFILNCSIMFIVIAFVVIPQLLYEKQYAAKLNASNNETVESRRGTQHGAVEFLDVFTGEGYFTNSALYYGFYINDNLMLIRNQPYHIPYSYFYTMLFVYIASFIIFSVSMARSYKKNFIETKSGLKNNYAHKIFCSWDYSIATLEAAELKQSSIYNELRELLSDSVKNSKKGTFLQDLWTRAIQIIINLHILVVLSGIGYLMWYLLEKHGTDIDNPSTSLAIATAVLINLIMLILPPIFSFIVRYEDYNNPRIALYITLVRIFLLKVVILGVFLIFWLRNSTNENCWETEIGQHIYRLILFNFLFSVLISAAVEGIRFLVYKYLWKAIGLPECDIARYTLQLMYNQTLLWVGLYFAPLLSVVVTIQLWLTWYVRRTCVLYFCRPSRKSWRAAQTHTVFLILSFLSLLLVLITYGYIIANVPTSNCGPFREYKYMYEMILTGMLKLERDNMFWKVLMYLTKPGTVALILVAMCVVVYYLRAKATAQIDMVRIIREMLLVEAKDKEFLLKYISKVTDGKWQYNLEDKSCKMWNLIHPSVEANETDSNNVSSGSDSVSDNGLLSARNHSRRNSKHKNY